MDKQLIPVFTGDLQDQTQLCNARDLHKFLESGQEFANWIKNRIEQYGFIEGEDYLINLSNRSGGKLGKRRTDYHLTLDMAKELAMVENNDQGRMVRRYFIKAEAELRQRMINELRDMARHVLPIPGVKIRARDGLRLREVLVLQEQSNKTMLALIEANHHWQKWNLHYQLRQINDALGIPTASLEEITGSKRPLTIGKGE